MSAMTSVTVSTVLSPREERLKRNVFGDDWKMLLCDLTRSCFLLLKMSIFSLKLKRTLYSVTFALLYVSTVVSYKLCDWFLAER